MKHRRDFSAWYALADEAVWDAVGLSADDLPDCDWYDWYASGVKPTTAARRAIENAGGY